MFRLDDVDLDFGDMEDEPVGSVEFADNAGKLSLGFTSSPSDIFCESPPPPKIPRRSEDFPGGLKSPARDAEVCPFQEPPTPSRTPANAGTQRNFSPIVRPDQAPRTPVFAAAPSPRREEVRKSAKKLPGPAGALPKLRPNQDLNLLSLPSKPRNPTPSQKSSSSQPSSQEEEPWNAARTAIGPLLWPTFEKYSIARVTAQASRRQLSARCKVPCMCLQLEEMAVESVDARVRLKDGSGVMNGTLHREALRSFKDLLKIGSVILLKLVSVFSPTPKTHYLNITRTNLLHVFGDGSVPPSLSIDLIRQWEAQCFSPPALPQRGVVRRPAHAPPMPPRPPHRPGFPGGSVHTPSPHRPGFSGRSVHTPSPHRPGFPGGSVHTPSPHRPGFTGGSVHTPSPHRPGFTGGSAHTPPHLQRPGMNSGPVQPSPVVPTSSVRRNDPDLSSLLDDGMDELLASSMCDEMLSDW